MRTRFFRPQVEQIESRFLPSTVYLHAGDSLQAAINNAQPGDQLILDAGATFLGPITLPYKDGDDWITIQTSALDQLPSAGQRVGPDDAPLMAKIASPGLGEPALQTAGSAHNYRFAGIEFLPVGPNALVFDLLDLGNGGSAQSSLDDVPYDLSLDQCYVHAWPGQPLKRGIALNSAYTEIVNSYIAGFKIDGGDSQAIAGWNGPGPFVIDNNYLEAAGENILFGGAVATIPGLVPSDIEIRNNLVSKPLAWNVDNPSVYQGQHWTVKNLLELKNAQRVTIDSNRFENNWVDGQVGVGIFLTPRGDQSGGPWVTVRDVTFTNNVVTHCTQGISILGSDDSSLSQVTENILIQNNLFDDVATGSPLWGNPGGPPKLFQVLAGISGGTSNVTFDGNVATFCQVILLAEGLHSGFAFTNNVMPRGHYGVIAYGLEGTAALDRVFPDYTFEGNTIISANPALYPADNAYGTTSDERFVMQTYLDLLQRPVDPAGLETWTTALAEGASRDQVVQGIEASPEFLAVEVNDLYQTFLHRPADASGLATFTDYLARGGTVEQVAEMLTGSLEYYLTQGCGTKDGFLDALYRDVLIRPVDSSGRATFGLAMARGASNMQIAAALFASQEYQQDVVKTFYQRYLHRTADSGGLSAFVAFLNRGSRDEDIIAAILSSPEYSAGLS